jgi:hypothetical protein
VPAGGLSPSLTPEEVARRELLEEVGGEAAELRYVGQFYTSNGISNEIAYVYLATGVELGETHREPTELMEVRFVPAEEALRMARSGDISMGRARWRCCGVNRSCDRKPVMLHLTGVWDTTLRGRPSCRRNCSRTLSRCDQIPGSVSLWTTKAV